jgi:replicative DNA helicase
VNHQIGTGLAKQFERLPPHSIESEMCVLASMMLDVSADREVVGDVIGILAEEDFFQADHAILFKALRQLFDGGRPIDAMILRTELEKRQLLEEIGGVEYLAAILNTVPNAMHGAEYARTVKEKSQLRELIKVSSDTLREAYSPHENAVDVLDRAEKSLFALSEKRDVRTTGSFEEAVHEAFESVEGRGQRGLATGFYELDDMLNGLQPGDLIILAARPSIGKTGAGDERRRARRGRPDATGRRVQPGDEPEAARAADALRARRRRRAQGARGMLQAHEFQAVAKVAAELASIPMFVDDSPSLRPHDLRAGPGG